MPRFFGENPPNVEIVRGETERWRVTHFDVTRADRSDTTLDLTEALRSPDFVAARAGQEKRGLVVDAPLVFARGSRIVVVDHMAVHRNSDVPGEDWDYYTHGIDIDLAELVGPHRAHHLLFLDLDSAMTIHVIPWGESGPDISQTAYSVGIIRTPIHFGIALSGFELSFFVVPRTLISM